MVLEKIEYGIGSIYLGRIYFHISSANKIKQISKISVLCIKGFDDTFKIGK